MPGRARRWIIAITGMVVGALGLGALLPVDAAEGDVTYVLAWDAGGVTTSPDGSWTTTTDLGYTVTVTAGELTTHTVTMVSCPHGHGLFGWLFGILGPGIADAGHRSGGDPALVGGAVGESLTEPDDIVLGTTTVDEPAYCEGHTAWGASDADVATVVIEATWTAPDGTTGVIDLATTIDWGVGGDLTDGTATVHVEVGEPTTVEVRRSLSTMFDGIDLASSDDTELAMGILRALADSTEFVVTGGIAHG